MSSYTGLSPKDPTKHIGRNLYLSTVVTRNRAPTGADYIQPESGKKYPTSSFWLVGPAPTTGTQGDLWYLSKIVANVAYWIKFGTGGGGPLLEVQVDAATAPGVNPVTPDLITGKITVTDVVKRAGQAGSTGVQTHTIALNQFQVETQVSSAIASTDITKVGLAAFYSTQFAVDANGFVKLAGGGTTSALQTLTGNDGLVTIADANNNINLIGQGGLKVTRNSASEMYLTVDALNKWQQISANQTLVKFTGYFVISGTLSLALPTTASSTIGDLIEVTLDGGTSFTITTDTGGEIRFGTLQTTVTTGTITTTQPGNTLRLVYQASGKWNVISSIGNFTVS